MTALGAIHAIHAHGLRVPEDISVTGFDDLFFAPYMQPPLTTIRQPVHRMGQLAMENLVKLISGVESVAHVKVDAELVIRESTALARTAIANRSAWSGQGIERRWFCADEQSLALDVKEVQSAAIFHLTISSLMSDHPCA